MEKFLSDYNELAKVIMEGFVATTRELVGGHIQKDREAHRHSLEVEKQYASTVADVISDGVNANQEAINSMNKAMLDEE